MRYPVPVATSTRYALACSNHLSLSCMSSSIPSIEQFIFTTVSLRSPFPRRPASRNLTEPSHCFPNSPYSTGLICMTLMETDCSSMNSERKLISQSINSSPVQLTTPSASVQVLIEANCKSELPNCCMSYIPPLKDGAKKRASCSRSLFAIASRTAGRTTSPNTNPPKCSAS